MIDENTWHRVQLERQRRSTKNVVTSSYLLTGLLVCGKCGAKMRYQKWGKDKTKIYCYSQQSSKQNLVKDPNCDNLRYDADELEKVVIDDVLRMADKVVADENAIPKINDSRRAGIKILQEKYDTLSAKIKRLYNLYAESEDNLLLETIKENQKELASLSKMLDNEKISIAAVDDIIERNNTVRNLRSAWDSLTIQEKQRALRICVRRIVVTDHHIDIEYLI